MYVAALMAGGPGTRLWPLSRQDHPKPFVPLTDTASPFQHLLRAVRGPALVLCGAEHRFLALQQAEAVDRPLRALLLEPVARGTAPAAAAAALYLQSCGEDGPLALLPTDAWYEDMAHLRRALDVASRFAEEGYFVLLGIRPSRPETQWGYIRLGEALEGGVCRVAGFVEKPDAERARRLMEEGPVLWNAGVFVVKASVLLALMERCRPEILEAVRASVAAARREGPFLWLERGAYERSPADSVDYALLEPLAGAPVEVPGFRGVAALPLPCRWSDLGLWPALWEVLARDEAGNASRGEAFLDGCRNTLVLAHSRLVGAIGLEDVAVVETPDAVLVVHHRAAPRVRGLVERLLREGRPEAVLPWRVHRPWGWYQVVDRGPGFQVKRLLVRPGARLSLQYHRHRAEHWVVVRGRARVTRGGEVFLLNPNESTFIPAQVAHRLENPGPEDLEVVEVQTGDYLGEDDIVRLEDAYGRATGTAPPPPGPGPG